MKFFEERDEYKDFNEEKEKNKSSKTFGILKAIGSGMLEQANSTRGQWEKEADRRGLKRK